MATRNIYNQEALFVGPSNATGDFFSGGNTGVNLVKQLHRVQSANYSINVDRLDVNEYGVLGRIDAIIVNPPTVSLDFSYLLTNVNNESGLGLTVNKGVNCTSGILAKTEDDRNYFISIAPQGQDNASYAGSRSVYGFGNGFLTSYTAEAAVGGLPTATVNIEAYNFKGYLTETGVSPAINPTNGVQITGRNFQIPVATTGYANQVSALRPGDIQFSLAGVNTLGVDPTDLKIQSFNLGVELARENIDKLGSLYPASKEIQVPINATLSVDAIVGDVQANSLSDIICNDQEYNLSVSLLEPACAPAVGAVAIQYQLKGAKLVSQSFSSSIGPSKTVSLQFNAQLSGPTDLVHGLFISGQID